jgi:Uma2 family endonuclease
MGNLLVSSPAIPTLADLLARLGNVPTNRVRYYPAPGTATVADVIEIERQEGRYCELVDGVLVEKPMAYQESFLAGVIITELNVFVLPRKLGRVTGEGGMMQLFPDLVRIPDVAFTSRDKFPGGKITSDPVPRLAPDLAIEVLSKSNTPAEMKRKREDYFAAGVRLVWIFDPVARTATEYTKPEQPRIYMASDTLSGGDVLPGFTLALAPLFATLDE